jgi:EAL domain-containing protein (putative c-di-GMP-specific phosphodiesterase class I)
MVAAVASALETPFALGGREAAFTASIGVAFAGEEHGRPEDLLRDADVALYQAKAAGKARWALFDERAREGAVVRLSMANELRRALDSSLLSVAYQPIVELRTGRMVAVEALARWDSESFGIVSPATFVALAEDMGLIEPLGEWVLRSACDQLARWKRALGSLAPSYVSVNLSVRQLNDSFVTVALTAIRDAGLRPRDVCLEVTESIVLEDGERGMSVLRELQALGFRLAMDDFGTGYSSLSSVRSFPGELLKIDRGFVVGTEWQSTGHAILEAVVAMARSVGLATVAEGVETASEAELLCELGVTYGQGYHLAMPMSSDELDAWLHERLAIAS